MKLFNNYPFCKPQKKKNVIGKSPYFKKLAILKLKSEIRALGHINLDAVDEYKEVSERYGFLTKQIEDLRKAKTELQILLLWIEPHNAWTLTLYCTIL